MATQPMTKKALTEALKAAGVMVRTKAPKAELEAEWEKLQQQQERPAKDGKPRRPAYTRSHALRDALAEGGTRQEIIDRLDALYVEHGGQSHERGAKATADIHLPVLQVFGVVEKDGEVYRLRQ